MSWKNRIKTDSWRDRITENTSEVESAARGAAQGVSMGFSDEMSGALDAATKNTFLENLPTPIKTVLAPAVASGLVADNIQQLISGEKTFDDIKNEYLKGRNESRTANAKAKEDNPYSYGTGQVGGSLATAFVPMAGQMNLAKAGALGATQALGDSEAEDIQGLATDTAMGAAIGAGTYGLMDKVISPALKYGFNKASEFVPDAVDSATKTIGKAFFGVDEKATENYLANRSNVNNAYSMGDLADSVLNKTDETSALNEMRKRSSELSNQAWNKLDDKMGMSKNDIIESINGYIDDPKTGLTIDGVTVGQAQEQAVKKLQGLKNQISQLSGEQISQSNLKRIIQNLDDNINWNNPEQGPTNDAIKSLRGYVDQTIKSQNPAYKSAMAQVEDVTKAQAEVKSVFQNRLNPENYDKFNKAVKNLINKDERSAANQAVDKIQEHTGYDLKKDIVNSWTKSQFEKGDINGSRKTLLGAVIGGAAGSIGGPVSGAVGSAVGSAAGYAADRFSGPIFKRLLDGKINSQEFLSKYSTNLGKYAPIISEASTRGPQALMATHFILSQRDPEYRSKIKSIEDEENN